MAAGPVTWFGAGLTAAAACFVGYTLLLAPPAVVRIELPPRPESARASPVQAGPAPAGRAPPTPSATPPSRPTPSPPGAVCPPLAGGARVNLSTASATDLQALPGIGPTAAQRIVDERQQAPFTTVDQLHDRHIVSALTLARIRDLVVLE